MDNDKNILFFDGLCGLCNGFVDFLIKRDSTKKIYYSPLQGNTARFLLPNLDLDSLNTVIYFRNGKCHIYSMAALLVLEDIGGIYALISKLLKLIPNGLRDTIYLHISERRYSLFGKRDQCRIPAKNEQGQFLA